MNRLALALLAFVDLLGCKAQVIDALEGTGGMDSSSPEAAAGDAQPEGAPAAEALAYYSFDEGMGTVVHDGSGNGHDGTLVGGAWTDAGRFGSAIRFSAEPDGGVDDWVVVNPFPQAGSEGSGWSVSFWLLVQSADFTGEYVSVLSSEIAMGGGWEVDILPPSAENRHLRTCSLRSGSRLAAAYSIAACACLAFGSWTHFVAVVDGSALTVQLFQDGVATAPVAALGEFVDGLPYLYMGRWGGAGRQLVGVLDEVAIFDRTLSTAEVAQLYAGVVP